MNVILAILILTAPFALAALLSWAGHRHESVHTYLLGDLDDRDFYRIGHDADAVRTRFERSPAWPSSGAMGERR